MVSGWRAGLAAVLVVAIAATGCGDDDSVDGGSELSSEARAYADELAVGMADGEGGLGVDDGQARCMADAVLAELGSEPFESAGLEPDDLRRTDRSLGEQLGAGVVQDDQASVIRDAWHDCADLALGVATSAATDFDLDDAGVECLADRMRDAGFVDRFVDALLTEGGPDPGRDLIQELLRFAQDCGGIDEGMLVERLAGSFASGGTLDADQARCVAAEVVARIGVDRLIEVTTASGEFDAAPPEIQQEMTRAVLGATGACGIPLDQQAGG